MEREDGAGAENEAKTGFFENHQLMLRETQGNTELSSL